MLGLQTPVLVFGGTAAVYLIIILLTLRKHPLGSWFNGLFYFYLATSIVWVTAKAISVTEGLVPPVPVYGSLIARDIFALLPILLAMLTFLFFERKGAHKAGIVGAALVLVIAVIDGNVLNFQNTLQATFGLRTPGQVVSGLIVLEWAGFTGGALVLAVMDYVRIQRPLHRNRILYWVTATLLIGLGEGLTLWPDAWLPQAGAVVRMSGVGLITYVTLTYYLPSIRAAARRFIWLALITLVTAGLFLGSYVVLQWAIASLHSGYVVVGAVIVSVLASIVFQPVRSAAARLVDRVVFGGRYDPARALRDYSAAITSILDLNTLVTMSMGTISTALEVRRGALLLTTEHQDGHVDVRIIPGMGPVSLRSAMFDPHSPILSRLRQASRPLSQYEIDVLPELRLAPLQERVWLEQLNMELYVPIRHQTLLVGILALGSKASDVPYTAQDHNVLSTLADQTAVALQNARLVSDLKKLNADMVILNDELTRTNRRLEKLDEAKTHFIQIASHELRTPLTQVRGYADILADAVKSERPTPAQVAQLSQGISRATIRLEDIISALLDVSEIDTKALSLYRMPLSLPSIMRMVAEMHQNAAQQRKQTFTVESMDDLPNVQGDAQRLVQAFSNIVGNCIKFTPDGGSIRISARRLTEPSGDGAPAEYVEVLIADTGIGIDPDDQELIFEKFYRVGSPDRHSTGSVKFKGAGPGLGLAIVRGIIQAHGGKVWVESRGHDEVNFPGSTFHVLLPATPQAAES